MREEEVRVDIAQLRCFVAVAEELHFGRAAQRLHLTTSPVSRQVRALERTLNADLFVRAHHDVQLTPAGIALYPRAVEVVRIFNDLVRMPLPRPADGLPLRMGISPIAPAELGRLARTVIEELYPTMHVEVLVEWSGTLIERLGAGLDLAMVNLPAEVEGVQTAVLLEQPYHRVLNADDPLAGESSLTIGQLSGHDFVMTTSRGFPQLMHRMRELVLAGGVHSVIELDTTDPTLVAAHLRQGRRCALSIQGTPQAAIFDEREFSLVALDSESVRARYGIAWSTAAVATDRRLRHIVRALTTPAAESVPAG